MVGDPGGFRLTTPETRFSPDGFWWWDGTDWKPAVSQDRLWQWNGHDWEPNRTIKPPGSGAGVAIGITVAAFAGVLALVAAIVVVILLTMGNQIADVFSNTAAALGP